MNNAIFGEVDGFKCCGVLLPPGCRVDNFWTLIPAGILRLLWNVGISGCWVCGSFVAIILSILVGLRVGWMWAWMDEGEGENMKRKLIDHSA